MDPKQKCGVQRHARNKHKAYLLPPTAKTLVNDVSVADEYAVHSSPNTPKAPTTALPPHTMGSQQLLSTPIKLCSNIRVRSRLPTPSHLHRLAASLMHTLLFWKIVFAFKHVNHFNAQPCYSYTAPRHHALLLNTIADGWQTIHQPRSNVLSRGHHTPKQ